MRPASGSRACATPQWRRASDVIVVAHGGPFEDPASVQACYDRVAVHGFLGASSIERLPVEIALKQTVEGFQRLRLKRSLRRRHGLRRSGRHARHQGRRIRLSAGLPARGRAQRRCWSTSACSGHPRDRGRHLRRGGRAGGRSVARRPSVHARGQRHPGRGAGRHGTRRGRDRERPASGRAGATPF